MNESDYLDNLQKRFNDQIASRMPEQTYVLTEEEKQKSIKKAFIDAHHQFYKTCFLRDMVKTFTETGVPPTMPKDPELKKMVESQADAVSNKPPYMLLTINPKPNITLPELKKVVEKVIKKKTITEYAYCYEVRKDDNTGLHAHILLKYEDKPYNFRRGVKNTCKHICDTDNPNILNFKFVEEKNLQQKIDYIKGIKKDSKKPGVKASIKYRIDNNLLPLYESSPPFPCRATQVPRLVTPIETVNIVETRAPSTRFSG